MPEKKSALVATRIPPHLRERLDASNHRHGTIDSTVVLRLLESYLDEVERVDAVRWPLKISMPAPRVLFAAEDAGNYEHGPAKGKPPKPPDKANRPRGAGPDHRVPKSA